MKWNLGRPNPRDPFTRFSSYKWLIARRLSAAISRTSPYARGRLLDVGCGHRRFEDYFQVDRYVGLEYPTTFGPESAPVDVFGTALSLPFADGTFDTVASFETLEHVTDSARMVDELRRVVRPGGSVIVSVPFLWGEHCQPHDYFRFTAFGLRQLFESRGLRVEHQERVGGFWTFYGQRLCYYLAEVYGRDGWRARSLAFVILVCASLLDALDPANAEYAMSVVVGTRAADGEA
jgi:SAM-dependent methyltransferase